MLGLNLATLTSVQLSAWAEWMLSIDDVLSGNAPGIVRLESKPSSSRCLGEGTTRARGRATYLAHNDLSYFLAEHATPKGIAFLGDVSRLVLELAVSKGKARKAPFDWKRLDGYRPGLAVVLPAWSRHRQADFEVPYARAYSFGLEDEAVLIDEDVGALFIEMASSMTHLPGGEFEMLLTTKGFVPV